MSESSKLIFGAALVAVGFGVATLLGPPQNNAQWQSFRGQSPLSPTVGQQATMQPQPLQLRAGDNNGFEPGASQTASSSQTRPTPQWLAPVSGVPSGMQSGVQAANYSDTQPGIQPTGLFSDRPTGHAQYASASDLIAGREQAVEVETPFNSSNFNGSKTGRNTDPFSKSRPVYEVAQKFTSTNSPQQGRDPLQDYADSHWLEDDVFEAGEQQHVVADGDTLAKLADIYLGDSQREWEIYHHNRDVLNSPELLPIGAILTIPARASSEVALDTAPMNVAPMDSMPAMVQASNQPSDSVPSTVFSPVSNSDSSLIASGHSAASEMPTSSYSPSHSSGYSGLSSSVYSAGQSSGEPDLVPVKPVAASKLAPHAHLLMPIPVD